MDLFVARTMITKASLVFRGPIEITESQVGFLGKCEASSFISIIYINVANFYSCESVIPAGPAEELSC